MFALNLSFKDNDNESYSFDGTLDQTLQTNKSKDTRQTN